MDCILSNEDQLKEAKNLGLDHESLYKRGLKSAAAHNLSGASAEDFAKDYVTGVIQEKVEIAKRLFAMNYDIKLTAEATGLPEDRIKNIQ